MDRLLLPLHETLNKHRKKIIGAAQGEMHGRNRATAGGSA